MAHENHCPNDCAECRDIQLRIKELDACCLQWWRDNAKLLHNALHLTNEVYELKKETAFWSATAIQIAAERDRLLQEREEKIKKLEWQLLRFTSDPQYNLDY